MPKALAEAIEAHRRTLEQARPFERVTSAAAVRDLLAHGIAAVKKPKRG
jgi:hypothetical protein